MTLTGLDDALPGWLPGQRWYAGKGRPLRRTRSFVAATLRGDDPQLHLVLVDCEYSSGPIDRYQLPLGLRRELPDNLQYAAIGPVECDGESYRAYDALHDAELTGVLLDQIEAGRTIGPVSFSSTQSLVHRPGRLLGGEQSNSSVVFGDDHILKVFRKITPPGLNPDLEVTRALAAVGSTVIAPPQGWYEYVTPDFSATLGLLQPFLRGGTDGWGLAITSVRDLLHDLTQQADEAGGDFAPEAHRLGGVTAAMHADLRAALPTRSTADAAQRAMSDQMVERLHVAAAAVPDLRPHVPELAAAYSDVAELTAPVGLQRIHGDYHLGQVLRTDHGWVVLDFEGEPARSLDERRAVMSPLRDVAGMLRSFDYAARHHLMDVTSPSERLRESAEQWATRNRTAFCDGYAEHSGSDPREQAVLLRAYQLDKAVYEVVYEARNRPAWITIPLGSIQRLVEK
ncbi:MAG TPA: phosphotransferase [Mycobacteriales bacterium]|nr:phosphotransferase [Mycobacteriales bacterium]